MRLLRRVIVFSGVAAIVLLIAVIVAYFTALRPYAHYRVESLLRDLGFAKSSFDIQQVSLDGITLANVSLGDPEAGRIGAARVTYSLGSLWDGRVHAVKLANVQWRVQVRDGVIETGFKPADGRTDRALDMPFDRLDLQSLKLTVENESGAHGFAVDGNMVRTAAGRFDADVQIASASGPAVRLGEVSVAGITGQLHVQARSDASQLTIALREDSMLAVDSLSVQTGDASIQSSPIRFQFVPSIQPTLRITGKGANQETSINLHAASASPVTVDSPHARAFVPELSIGMTATLRENQPATVSADVILSHASVKSEAAQFLASGVDAIVPIDINGPVRRGPVAVRSVMWRDKSLPAVAATIAVTSRHLEFDAAWTPLTGAAMSAAGSLDFSGPSPRGEFTATVPPFEFVDAALLQQLFPVLADAQVGGRFAVEASAELVDGTFLPRITLDASDFQLQNPEWPVSIGSASASILIDGVAPFSTATLQRVLFQKATFGNFEVTDGDVVLTVENPNLVRIESAAWSMAEYGRFVASPFTLNPSDAAFETTITGEDIGLGPWLVLLTNGRATGEGLLEGSVAMTVQPSARYNFQVGLGSMHAQPQTGWIHINDTSAINSLVDAAKPAIRDPGQWEQVRSRFVAALHDFEFMEFQVEFLPENGDAICRVRTRGKGRTGENPLQFQQLTVNFTNFNHLLNEALLLRSALGPRE